MNRLYLFVSALLILGAAAPLMAADPGVGSPYTVHIDALALLFDEISVGGEFALPVKNVSVAADVQYSPNFLWVTNVSFTDLAVKGRYYFGDLISFALPDYLTFLKKGPMAGAFVGAGISTHSWSYNWSSVTWNYFSAGVLGEVGSKYFFGDHLYLEGILGLDLHFPGKWTTSSGSTTFGGTNNEPSYFRYGVYGGYAF